MATNVIDHQTHGDGANGEAYEWEQNLLPLQVEGHADNYWYYFKEACAFFGIEHNRFIEVLNELSGGILNET